MFEECNGNSTRAHMGSDGGTQSADGKLLGIILPEMLTVVNVFLQKFVTQTGIAQTEGLGEVHAVRFFNFTDEEVTAVFGTTGFSQHNDLTVYDCYHGLDGQSTPDECHSGGDTAPFFQVFQSV